MAEFPIADVLRGMGAVLGGEFPQFQQQMAQRESARQQAMYQDAYAAQQLLSKGDYDGVISLGLDRMNILNRLGIDSTDTQGMVTMAQAARAGNQQAATELQGMLGSLVNRGYATGALTRAPRERVTLGESQDLYEIQPDGSYKKIASGPSKEQKAPTPQTTIAKIQSDVNSGLITPEQGQQEIEREQRAATQEQQTAISEANQIYDIANRLLNSDMSAITGSVDTLTPTFRAKSIQQESDAKALEDLLTLQNLGRMSGVLSESDIKILRQAATGGLNLAAGEVQYKNALRRIVGALQRSAESKGFALDTIKYDRDYYDVVEERASMPYHESGYPMPETQDQFDLLFIGEKYVDPDDGLLYIKQ